MCIVQSKMRVRKYNSLHNSEKNHAHYFGINPLRTFSFDDLRLIIFKRTLSADC